MLPVFVTTTLEKVSQIGGKANGSNDNRIIFCFCQHFAVGINSTEHLDVKQLNLQKGRVFELYLTLAFTTWSRFFTGDSQFSTISWT